MSLRTAIAWSGGKDSAWMMHSLLKHPDYKPVSLLTTLEEEKDTVTMHEVSRAAIERQAEHLNLPVEWMYLPLQADNETYKTAFQKACQALTSKGVEAIAFGDIFLKDLRGFREDLMTNTGLQAVFPIWEMDTSFLAHAFVQAGFRAKIVCLDANRLDEKWLGHEYDQEFLDQLPKEIDPAGENGEFHSFVYEGPIFQRPLPAHAFGRNEHPLQRAGSRYLYCHLNCA